jgi:multicomponent Na+:H+ antiporter subunit F
MSLFLFDFAYIILFISCALCVYRIGRGPTAPDRAASVYILGIVIVSFTALYSLQTASGFYIDVGLSWAILSFITEKAFSKHLEGKGFDE